MHYIDTVVNAYHGRKIDLHPSEFAFGRLCCELIRTGRLNDQGEECPKKRARRAELAAQFVDEHGGWVQGRIWPKELLSKEMGGNL